MTTLDEGIFKNIKRAFSGTDVESRIHQKRVDALTAGLHGDEKKANRDFRHYKRLEKLSSKTQNEETEQMSTTKELIDAIVSGDSATIMSSFEQAMAERISERLDDMRVGVAQGMFRTEQVELDEAKAKQAFKVGDRAKIHMPGYAAHGHSGVIQKIHSDGNVTMHLNPGKGASGTSTKMKLHGGVFGPEGSDLEGINVKQGGTHTTVHVSTLKPIQEETE